MQVDSSQKENVYVTIPVDSDDMSGLKSDNDLIITKEVEEDTKSFNWTFKNTTCEGNLIIDDLRLPIYEVILEDCRISGIVILPSYTELILRGKTTIGSIYRAFPLCKLKDTDVFGRHHVFKHFGKIHIE